MAFKQDDDFLRFITMGAAGTALVARDFAGAHRHQVIELERYAMANKIWATKIKRLRLADLVCIRCGRRVEARAKSELKVRMSHSATAGREWDAGLREDDLCAFVPWDGDSPSGPPHYFTVGAMRAAAEHARLGQPKAASEGSERDMTWPMRLATRDGVVERIDLRTGRVTYRPLEGRRQTVRMPDGVPVHVYVGEGDEVCGGRTFVMGCLVRPGQLRCPGDTWDLAADLLDGDASTRYAAVKAAGARGDAALEGALLDLAEDGNEDDRVRLEGWASLARLDPGRYTGEVAGWAEGRAASGDRQAMPMAMEAILILSELRTDEAADALTAFAADRELDSEVRCAAVWGLGTAGVDDAGRVLGFIADGDEEVALHALAGIGHVSGELLGVAAEMLGGTDVDAASAAALLARQGEAGIEVLLRCAAGEGRAAVWAVAGLGQVPEADVRAASGSALEGGLERALAPVWAARASWLGRYEVDGPLGFLERQAVRHLP